VVGVLLTDNRKAERFSLSLMKKGNDILIGGSLDCYKGGRATMNTRNWIIAAVAVVLLIAIYFVFFQPGAEAPTEITAPPATTEPAPAQ
jgi:hypothetical protein